MADKGFNYSHFDTSFVNQKKNHFQVSHCLVERLFISLAMKNFSSSLRTKYFGFCERNLRYLGMDERAKCAHFF